MERNCLILEINFGNGDVGRVVVGVAVEPVDQLVEAPTELIDVESGDDKNDQILTGQQPGAVFIGFGPELDVPDMPQEEALVAIEEWRGNIPDAEHIEPELEAAAEIRAGEGIQESEPETVADEKNIEHRFGTRWQRGCDGVGGWNGIAVAGEEQIELGAQLIVHAGGLILDEFLGDGHRNFRKYTLPVDQGDRALPGDPGASMAPMHPMGRDEVRILRAQFTEESQGVETGDIVPTEGSEERQIVGVGVRDMLARPEGERFGIDQSLVGGEDDEKGHTLFFEQFLQAGKPHCKSLHLVGWNLGRAQGIGDKNILEKNRRFANDEGPFTEGRRFNLAEEGVPDLAIEIDEPAPQADVLAYPGIRRGRKSTVQPG